MWMGPPPKALDGADLLVWATLDEWVTPTGYCSHSVAGADLGPADALAVCVYADRTREYYLFHCDRQWQVLTDTLHDTLELAQRQAEAEYAGVSGRWRLR
jgi:hypothetical protein